MRKILIAIITILLIILAFTMVMNMVEIGNLEILGIEKIEKQKNDLNKKIEEGNSNIKIYKSALSNIDSAYDNLQKAKEEYEEKVKVIASSKREEAKLLRNYSIEFLWIQIGLHRKEEGVDLELTLSNNGSSTETDLLTNREVALYDIKFTVTGRYDAITDFIYDIEEDSSLGFGIEDFELNPGSDKTSNLVAEFVCKDIRIYKDSVSNNLPIYNFNTNTENQNTTDNNANTNENTTDNNANTDENTTDNNANTDENTTDNNANTNENTTDNNANDNNSSDNSDTAN